MFAICYSGDSGEHELIATCSGKLTPIQLDITKDDQVRKVARTIKAMLGERGKIVKYAISAGFGFIFHYSPRIKSGIT